ncbi:MAG: NAD-dependent epimerase/dehydratase family protein [Balneolaceae bacterium]
MVAFVTGGTGFIGSHLVEALIKSEKYSEVRCLVRNEPKWISGLEYIKISGDLDNFNALSKGLEGADVLFHIAAIVKAPSKKEFTYANVDATETLVRIAQKKSVKNMVILSSLAAAGPSSGTPVTEKDAMHPVSMYGKSKKEMEERVRKITDESCSIKIIRPPAVYGPREDQIYSFFQAFSKGICPIVGDGNNPRLSMVYVDDLVDGILKAAQKTDTGIHTFFITGEGIHTWNQIRAITGKVMGKKAIPIKIKPQLVKKAAGVIEGVASLFGKYPVINKEKANELILEWTCSGEKARKELDFHPQVSLAEGISRTIHWYKRHNWL